MVMIGNISKMLVAAGVAYTNYTHKLVLMRQHLELVAQLSRHYGGNENFATLEPHGLVQFAAAMHDAGWIPLDGPLTQDPETHMPRNLLFAPDETISAAAIGSGDIGEAHHPYAGLLISMHHTGLRNNRYDQGGGKVPQLQEQIQEKQARAAKTKAESPEPAGEDVKWVEKAPWLDTEAERQELLIAVLKEDPETAAWVTDEVLWTNYKAIQFFDTLALYFCLSPKEDRTELNFPKVPTSTTEDVTVKITPRPDGTYELHPFPFAMSPTVVTLSGTLIRANEAAVHTDAAINSNPIDVETITFVAKDL